ncbi:MAG: hypothetical protein ACI870_000162 [Crocinitomicaceae bacterium]|jgi:hypothetical protein
MAKKHNRPDTKNRLNTVVENSIAELPSGNWIQSLKTKKNPGLEVFSTQLRGNPEVISEKFHDSSLFVMQEIPLDPIYLREGYLEQINA